MISLRIFRLTAGATKVAVIVSILNVLPLLASGQGCNSFSHLPEINGAAPVREPEALHTLRASLAALGGDGWASVSGVRITGTIAATARHPATQFTSIEDFSRPAKPRLSRTTTEGSSMHKMIADENLPSVTATLGTRKISVPRMPPLEIIATENPAIAIAFAIHKPHISVCVLHNTKELDLIAQDVKWVRLFHWTPRGTMATVDVAISNTTSLPVLVRRMLPSFSPFAPATWEDAKFSGFASQSGLTMPTGVHLGGSSLVPSDVTYQAVELNPSISTTEFPGDAQ